MLAALVSTIGDSAHGSLHSFTGAIWWCLAIALLSATLVCGLAQPFSQRRRATRKDQPPISAIAPVKLLNPGFEIAQAFSLATIAILRTSLGIALQVFL
jgi:hypothetical protein